MDYSVCVSQVYWLSNQLIFTLNSYLFNVNHQKEFVCQIILILRIKWIRVINMCIWVHIKQNKIEDGRILWVKLLHFCRQMHKDIFPPTSPALCKRNKTTWRKLEYEAERKSEISKWKVKCKIILVSNSSRTNSWAAIITRRSRIEFPFLWRLWQLIILAPDYTWLVVCSCCIHFLILKYSLEWVNPHERYT